MRYKCPVCLYADLPYPPKDYHICPCCGTEFGNDDQNFTYEQIRQMWIGGGATWFFGHPPDDWNPWMQLIVGDLASAVPKFADNVTTTTAVSSVLLEQVSDWSLILSAR
jgi:hypothetical protein